MVDVNSPSAGYRITFDASNPCGEQEVFSWHTFGCMACCCLLDLEVTVTGHRKFHPNPEYLLVKFKAAMTEIWG